MLRERKRKLSMFHNRARRGKKKGEKRKGNRKPQICQGNFWLYFLYHRTSGTLMGPSTRPLIGVGGGEKGKPSNS